ncbi:GntR family transcriptional regulator [Geochorda subterranea]|uniref:GntR family transcriptional regulator n=1 Tax=Geochorda subterranea TaxID=3109564 RepID=A0ABZ1BQ11_9FIRM|nr:GntR family transcriptional regulator [Limnochorda sp. LNt]WRP14491.1 GntR family transcriptional regulator [Limnochorda sp. LNt]
MGLQAVSNSVRLRCGGRARGWSERAETQLVRAILQGRHRPGTWLPPERELAALLGVSRPALREALQRLALDGWITLRRGQPAVVIELWRVSCEGETPCDDGTAGAMSG